jgi:hypothetical protein
MKKLFKEFTAAQLARLKKEYDPLKGQRIPMNQIEKMQNMLSKYSTDMLVKLANTDIPFIATAAKNIAVTKRGKKWSDFKTKLDMAEADELQCEACWDSHKQVGTKISSKTGKRVPNCVPKEELQEALNKDDKETIKPIIKQLQKSVKAHDKQAKQLTKDLKDEADMSKSQIKKVHDKADDLPKKDFIKRYGKDGDSVRYATATNMVKKKLGIEDMEENKKITISKIKNNNIKNDIMVMVKKDNLNISLTPSSNGVQADGDEKDILKLVKGLNNKHMSNIINPSNPPYVINMEEAFTKKDFKDNERDNEHGENAKIVVGLFGTPQDVAVIDAINARHKKQRYISKEDQKKRDAIVNKYYGKLKEGRVLTNPEVAVALRQYIAQRPFISNKKDYEELMKLSLKDMGAFNTKFKSMNTDSQSGVKAALAKKGLSSTLVNDNKPKGDQTMNESYKDKFNATMKKFGINSLDDLKSDEEKKKFFKAVDDSHDAKNEEVLDEKLDNKDLQYVKVGNYVTIKGVEYTIDKLLPNNKIKVIDVDGKLPIFNISDIDKGGVENTDRKVRQEEGAMKRGSNLDTFKPKPKSEDPELDQEMTIKAMKTGDADLTPDALKLNAMVKDPHKSKGDNPKKDLNATYTKSDVRPDVKNGGGADMSKIKDAPEMMTAMAKINATKKINAMKVVKSMYKTEKYLDERPGSIQNVVAQMQMNEQKSVTIRVKELSAMVETYLAKGGVTHNIAPSLTEAEFRKVLPLKEVRTFIDTYNKHFLTNYRAEEFIVRDRLEG